MKSLKNQDFIHLKIGNQYFFATKTKLIKIYLKK